LSLDAPTLAAEIAAGRLTAEAVTRAALERIAAIDDAGPMLNAIIEINPDAIDVARALDARFAVGGIVGPLHGLPLVLKANIDTADNMATSAGSFALADHHAKDDAPLVAKLRAAGAVIVAKANLSEWANFRSRTSSSGFSELGGQTANPYILDRNPCGSSSGSAVAIAARLVPLAVGTETDGSIICPAGTNGIVGIKPTVGLVDAQGIIPIASTQDTAGPMARTVRGAAMLLAAMQSGAQVAILSPTDRTGQGSLRGIRIGAIRNYYGAGSSKSLDAAYEKALSLLADAGASIIDPVTIPLSGDVRAAEFNVMLFEFKAGIDAYLAAANTGPRSLADLIDYNARNPGLASHDFGQDIFVAAEAQGDLDDPRYVAALVTSRDAVRAALAGIFGELDLDALVAPSNSPAWRTDWDRGDANSVSSASYAAISGYPSISVPAALIDGLPVGISFIGTPYSEAALIEIAAAFESRRGAFPEPRFLPTLD